MDNGTLDIAQLIQFADKIGTITLLILFLWGIKEKWIVPGWVYTACEDRSNTLESHTSAYATKLEEKLNRLEEDERKRWQANVTR
jgi:hypothetical protein